MSDQMTPVGGRGDQPVAVIPNVTLKAGLFGMKSRQYVLVLTDQRVVFVRVTTERMKQLVADTRQAAKAQGKGFLGAWGAQLGAYSTFAQDYLAKSPEEALAENPDNFAVDRAGIVKVKLKSAYSGEDVPEQERLLIKTTDRKYQLTLASGKSQAQSALRAAQLV